MQKGSALSRAAEHLSGGESGVGEDIVVWVPFGTDAHLQRGCFSCGNRNGKGGALTPRYAANDLISGEGGYEEEEEEMQRQVLTPKED